MSKGIIFKYMNKNGKIVKAVALHDDQKTCYSSYGKVFLRILNDDYTLSAGRNIIAIKNSSELTRVGYWN